MCKVEPCQIEQPKETAICAGASVLAVGLITMLVCGILGRLNKLPMAPIGARIMTGIPLTVVGLYLGSSAVSSCR